MELNRYCPRCRTKAGLENFYYYPRNRKNKKGEDEYYYVHKKRFCKKANKHYTPTKKNKLLWNDHLNPKTIKEMQKWYDKNKCQIIAYSRNIGRYNIQRLTNGYLKSILLQSGFSKKQLDDNPEIVKTKRELIKINRLLK